MPGGPARAVLREALYIVLVVVRNALGVLLRANETESNVFQVGFFPRPV
jgi:hypothetical protein